MASKFRQWISERLPINAVLQSGLNEEIPGGSSFFFTLGSALLFVFMLQVITGIWQLFYYVPTVDHAYNSLSYLRISVPYGWLIHGIHYWGANIMAVLVGLHMIRVFIWGAHKKPRELTWIMGVFLLLFTVGLIFTGAALPWDERGYWAAEVGTSIAGTVPYMGKALVYLIRGGMEMGQLTLSRFFVLHTVILPVIVMIFIGIHLAAFRQYGSIGPWQEAKRQKKGYFWPEQIAKDMIVSALILFLLIALSVYSPPPFTGPVDLLDSSFQPKPEWNFLFLYQILKGFTGSLEIIGTVGIPSLIVLLLIAVPFLDRKKERNPLKRPAMMIGGLVFVAFVFILTVVGNNSKPAGSQSSEKIVKAKKTIKLSPSAIRGKTVFQSYACLSCHKMSGKGGKLGPDLTDESQKGRSRDWIITQITNSKKHFPKSIMPPFTMLSNKQLNDLADFVLSPHPQTMSSPVNTRTSLSNSSNNIAKSNLKGVSQIKKPVLASAISANTIEQLKKLGPPREASNIIGNAAHGSLLFKRQCESCHGVNGKGGIPNPGSLAGKVPGLNPIDKILYNKDPNIFAENIDRFIQHGSIPTGTNPSLKMFDYGDSRALTQQKIAHIEAFVLYLNKVDRAQIEVSDPHQFFRLTVWVYLGAILIIIIFAFFVKKEKDE